MYARAEREAVDNVQSQVRPRKNCSRSGYWSRMIFRNFTEKSQISNHIASAKRDVSRVKTPGLFGLPLLAGSG